MTVSMDQSDVTTALASACEAAGASFVEGTLRSIHQRPGRSASYVYAAVLDIEGVKREVVLVAHLDRRGFPDDSFVLQHAGKDVAVWRFPHDPYLPGLASAIDPSRVRQMLDALGGPAGEVRLLTRAYRPSRRAVVEVRVDAGSDHSRVVYFKVFGGNRAAKLANVHNELSALVPVPRVVGVAARQGIVVLEALPGRTLAAAVGTAALPDPAELVEISTRMASVSLSTGRDPRAFADPVRHVELLRQLVPGRGDQVAQIAGAASTLEAAPATVHGDWHGGQLLLDDAGAVTGVLDVDGAGTGYLAHDAGNLIAHIEVLGEVRPQIADAATAYAAAIADAYRPVVGREALARATAAAWIGLATGPHRSQDTDWRERTHGRIDRAATALMSG